MEAVREDIPQLFADDHTLFDYVYKHGKTIPMSANTGGGSGNTCDPSGRPALRVPLFMQAGGNFSQVTADGGSDDMGLGSGSNFAALFIPPVTFSEACQISFKAQWASDSSKSPVFRSVLTKWSKLSTASSRTWSPSSKVPAQANSAQIDSTAVVSNNTGTGAQTSSITGFSQAVSSVRK